MCVCAACVYVLYVHPPTVRGINVKRPPEVEEWVKKRDALILRWKEVGMYDPSETWGRGAASFQDKVTMAKEARQELGWGTVRFDNTMNTFTIRKKYRETALKGPGRRKSTACVVEDSPQKVDLTKVG